MNRVEELIPKVMAVLKNEFKNGVVDKEYNGYISSFGASVLMSGLKASVAMFESEKSQTKADRRKLMNLILKVLDEKAKDDDKLLDYILKNQNKEDFLRNEILNIATAMKLCIRTFKFKE